MILITSPSPTCSRLSSPSPPSRYRLRSASMSRRDITSNGSSSSSSSKAFLLTIFVVWNASLQAEAFTVPQSLPSSTTMISCSFPSYRTTSQPRRRRFSSSAPLYGLVADRIDNEADEKETNTRTRKGDNGHNSNRKGRHNDIHDNGDERKTWILSKNGGFIPNLASSIRILKRRQSISDDDEDTDYQHQRHRQQLAALEERRPPRQQLELNHDLSDKDNDVAFASNSVHEQLSPSPSTSPTTTFTATTPHIKEPLRIWVVNDIHRYKEVVADEQDKIVVVRFYAPWCRACRAIQSLYRRLPKDFIHVTDKIKFVEVPVTKDNTYLHRGLGIPSLPFGHIYHPTAGLVEEMKISKHHFATFKQTIDDYVNGQCDVEYLATSEDDDGTVTATSASSAAANKRRQAAADAAG